MKNYSIMKIKGYFFLIAMIIITGCTAAENQLPLSEKKSHSISITGLVTSLNRTNIDKSGSNPKFMLHFIIKIEKYDDGGWDTILGPSVKCVIREEHLINQTGESLKTGDRIFLTSHIIDRSPEVIDIQTVKILKR